ncbi:unnamed protein product, partial [Didymodactylos carnosus]
MSNFNQEKNFRERIESSDNQELISRYNLRKRKLISTTEYETQQSSDKTTSLPLIIDENTPVSIEDVNQVLNQFIEYFDDRTPKKKEEIEKLINVILNKLPMLKDVKETDLCKWDLVADYEEAMRHWASLVIIILHEISHIIRRVELPITNDVMSATTPAKLLHGKLIKEAGNQLEILLFGNVVKSIGDLDSIFLLKSTSWNIPTIEEFHKQFKDHIEVDIRQQPNNDESYRLTISGKCGDLD